MKLIHFILFSLITNILSLPIYIEEDHNCSDQLTTTGCNVISNCFWCETTSSCGACVICTGELKTSEGVCPGDYYLQCYSQIECTGFEITNSILLGIGVLVFISLFIYFAKKINYSKNIYLLIPVIFFRILAVIGFIILFFDFNNLIVSICWSDYDLFVITQEIMLIYILLMSLLVFIICISGIIASFIFYLNKKLKFWLDAKIVPNDNFYNDL